MAPHKDTFLTSVKEPGNPYNVAGEPFPDFQAALATISGGPVMSGSGIGYTNWTLLNYSIRADGLIMRGDRPSTLPDSLIYQFVFDRTSSSDHVLEDDYVMSTDVRFDQGPEYTIGVRPKTLDCDKASMDHFVTQTCLDVQQDANEGPSRFSVRTFHAVPSAADSTICGWEWFSSTLAVPPLLIQGERFKWVPVSKQRISAWHESTLSLIGAPNEIVVFEHLDVSSSPVVRYADECQLDANGLGQLFYNVQDLQHFYCNGKRQNSTVLSERVAMCTEQFPMPNINQMLSSPLNSKPSAEISKNDHVLAQE